jgi:hypothetical protein
LITAVFIETNSKSRPIVGSTLPSRLAVAMMSVP